MDMTNATLEKPPTGSIEVKVKGSNGNKFTIYKSIVSYQLMCCGQHSSINYDNLNWLCKKCGNELPREALQKKK